MTIQEIELLKQKNEIAFDKFYDKYHKLFFSIIYKIVTDFASTEDLVSETFCKIIEDINQYRGGNFKYWCITIAKNIAYMYLRKTIQERKKIEKYIEFIEFENDYQDENNIIENNINKIIHEQLLNDIMKLVDKNTYEIIILHLVENLKFREIAEVKNTSTSSILGKYNRGIKKIRSSIKHEDYR